MPSMKDNGRKGIFIKSAVSPGHVHLPPIYVFQEHTSNYNPAVWRAGVVVSLPRREDLSIHSRTCCNPTTQSIPFEEARNPDGRLNSIGHQQIWPLWHIGAAAASTLEIPRVRNRRPGRGGWIWWVKGGKPHVEMGRWISFYQTWCLFAPLSWESRPCWNAE